MIAREENLNTLALSMHEQGSKLLIVAAKVANATGCPVIGGVAVFLHGYRRTTDDVDLLVEDTAQARSAIESIGATWDDKRAEARLEGVPIHLVPISLSGSPPAATTEIQGVLTVSLADLIRYKLQLGLGRIERARDLADVVELVRRVPLDKSFVAKLPRDLRQPFREIVDAVRRDEQSDQDAY